MNTFSLESDGPHTYKLELDGKDISDVISAVSLSVTAGTVPHVKLSLVAGIDVALRNVPAEVAIGEDDRKMLISIGWTPPEETS